MATSQHMKAIGIFPPCTERSDRQHEQRLNKLKSVRKTRRFDTKRSFIK